MQDEGSAFSIRKLFRRWRIASIGRTSGRSPGHGLVERGRFAEDAGDLDEAVRLYREAIRIDPGFAPAHMSLGIALDVGGEASAAMECHATAVALDPRSPPAHYNLGLMRLSTGDLPGAEASFRKALSHQESFPEAWVALAEVLESSGRNDEALQSLGKAIRHRPRYVGALENEAAILEKLRRLPEACSAYRRMLEIAPDSADTHFKLGTLLQTQGSLPEAEVSYRHAIGLRANYAMAMNSLATVIVLSDGARLHEAETLYRKAVEIEPEYALAHGNLGNVLQIGGRLSESETCLRRALELKPDFRQGHVSLGNALKDLGRVGEAIASYRAALDLDPDDRYAQDSLLMTLNYSSDLSRAHVAAEHFEWARRLEALVAPEPHRNFRDSSRRLRIGYLSPDFRRHSVAYFIEPVLAQHDRTAFEVHCYSNVAIPDPVTKRLLDLAGYARSVVGFNPSTVAEMIRSDGIDILVDLAGHTAGNLMEVLAREPAPVQVTYLGYPNTTGLGSVGWRITDLNADPEGDGDEYHSERLARLERTFLCFRPPESAPDVQPTPAIANGYITFGSFNALPKITTKVRDAWSTILNRVSRSRLLLKAPGLGDSSARARVLHEFALGGIAPDRLTLLPTEGTLQAHLARYHEVDIGLDPFPFNGTTTTLEALWMGVPVIALRGDRHAARVSASILANAGLSELIAENADSYVARAESLAGDLRRLEQMRRTMRERLECSPLRDEAGTVKALESAYRAMWEGWCAEVEVGN